MTLLINPIFKDKKVLNVKKKINSF